MDKIEKIMAEARTLRAADKLTNRKTAELCLEKFQYMLETGGMEFEIWSNTCPACLKYELPSDDCTKKNSSCMLAQAKHSCHKKGSHWKAIDRARDSKDQAAFTTQVKWFVAFFEKWLKDNPE